jgi:hypothetical protein
VATERDIEVIEDNDPVVIFTCKVDGQAIDLTEAEVNFYLKPNKATEEVDESVARYSTETGEIILRPQTGDTLGQLEVHLEAADLTQPAKLRYRLDVVLSGKTLTYAYGRVIVIDV